MKVIIGVICTFVLCIDNIYSDELDINLSENVRFFLYTRAKGEVPQQLYIDDEQSIKASGYNISKVTKFYTHALNKSYLDDDSSLVRKGFLKNDNFNVIIIDWGNIAKTRSYENVVGYTKAIGGYIAKMIDFLVNLGSKSLDMSLVGHSLGAQFMGSAGYLSSSKIGHVVGLDPIRNGIDQNDPESHISKESAILVEVIHTSDNSTSDGHLDFYPNGGKIQPSCDDDCSQERAYVYYAEALMIPKNWFGIQCDDYDAFLREDYVNKPITSFPLWIGRLKKPHGSYYLRTAASEPYGLGFAGLRPQK